MLRLTYFLSSEIEAIETYGKLAMKHPKQVIFLVDGPTLENGMLLGTFVFKI